MTRDPLNMVLIPVYSQLPSISVGSLFHLQPEDTRYRDANGLAYMLFDYASFIFISKVVL